MYFDRNRFLFLEFLHIFKEEYLLFLNQLRIYIDIW